MSGILTTSSNFITGTGLKKWSPQNLSGRLVAEAISEIGNEEVLLENMQVCGATLKMESLCF